jgi:DNA-binding MarR family transcriptional regulator
VKKRLIARETNMTDRRGAYLSLTPAGEKLYNELMPHVQSMNKQIMSVLSEYERQQLDQWLEKLGSGVQQLNRELTSSLSSSYRSSSSSVAGDDDIDHLG